MRVLEMANLKELISSLPEGLETRVGENGLRLSGGQRQRIGIARALYRSPKILVFDEATSSLDGKTEANLSSAIDALRGLTTILIIAHRLTTVKDADLVVYLEAGKIKAAGTFQEIVQEVPDLTKYMI